jgi:hypothetical protein
LDEKLLRVGDRVNINGRDGIFLVLSLDAEKGTASLLPPDSGKLLDEIPVDRLTILPRQEPDAVRVN